MTDKKTDENLLYLMQGDWLSKQSEAKMIEYPDGSFEMIGRFFTRDTSRPSHIATPITIKKARGEQGTYSSDESRFTSARRAVTALRRRVLAGQMDRLVTLTYRGAMSDYEKLLKDFREFVRRMNRNVSRLTARSFEYVAVPERHKSGGWHIHIAVKGRQEYQLLRRVWWSIVGQAQGNIDVRNPNRDRRSKIRMAMYLAKYISKNCSGSDADLFDRKKYWSSRGIEVPTWQLHDTDYYDMVDLITAMYQEAASRGCDAPVFWMSSSGDSFWLAASPRPPDDLSYKSHNV